MLQKDGVSHAENAPTFFVTTSVFFDAPQQEGKQKKEVAMGSAVAKALFLVHVGADLIHGTRIAKPRHIDT